MKTQSFQKTATSWQFLGVWPVHLSITGMAAQGFVSLDIKAFVKVVISWLLAYCFCVVIAI